MYQAALVLIVAALIALFVGPLIIQFLTRLKVRQVVSEDAPARHMTKTGTPTMGGLIILIGAAGAVLALDFDPTQPGFGLLLFALLCGGIGFLDDYLIVRRGKALGLRAREKLGLQIASAVLFLLYYYLVHRSEAAEAHLPFLKPSTQPLLLVIQVLLHGGLLVGFSNAVNLTDGLDGLAAGVTIPCWLTLLFLGGILPFQAAESPVPDASTTIFCAAMAGATLGYLWFNAHPARVFMGDTGSLAIGGSLAAAAILLHLEWTLLLIAAVPLAETVSVMVQVAYFKATGGKRVFLRSPLHHHFEDAGWPETHVVARFTTVSALCCVAAAALVLSR